MLSRLVPRLTRVVLAFAIAGVGMIASPLTPAAQVRGGTLPAGFTETVVFSGLTNPTALEFATDGRVFVAEKSGIVKVFDSLSDTTPDQFVDLSTNVYNFWDRGLLGLALHPAFPSTPYVYVLYTYDHILGEAAPPPRWGTPGVLSDGCPGTPGPTTDGCVVSARLSRLTAAGNQATGGETVLVEDWCQQFPSHSVGTVMFGADGALYVGGGEGASFNFTDWGQTGIPLNPCGDPPAGVSGTMTSPTAEGGAMRSQDLRTRDEPPETYADVLSDLAPTAYWRLGESSGTVADDSVGTSNGTYTNGPILGRPGLLTGDADTAIATDGTNDHVLVPSSAALRPTTAMSVVAWIQPDAWGTFRRVLQKETSETSYMLRATTNAQRLEFRINNVGQAWTQTLPSVGARHLVVGTYGAGRIRLYVDGVKVSDRGASGTIPSSTGPLAIAGKPGSGTAGDFFDGVIDEVSIHHTALTASNVTALWQAGTAPVTPIPDPMTLDGSIIRIDPLTGTHLPDNPLAADPDPNAKRIVAHGFRNPFRFTIRPGTNEIWIGDVGAGSWEEIDRLTNPVAAPVENFGWPCYEGVPIQGGYDGFDICADLIDEQPATLTPPYFAYSHNESVVSGDGCAIGSTSGSGLAFYEGGSYPASYDDGIFFADYSRRCIWFAPAGANGLPDFSQRTLFMGAAEDPVQLKIGPGGDLFYVDFDGSIRRISFAGGNQPPTAVATAVPENGPAPLDVQFDGSQSSDPEGGALTYAWDLDGDLEFDDSSAEAPTWTYPDPGSVTVRLRVTDPDLATGTDSVVVSAGNTAPTATIDTPSAGFTWRVGEEIDFSGHAADAQDGDLDPTQLSWSVILHHCPSNCHEHPLQDFPGVAAESFPAPDHTYPSHLELRLTATDSGGLTDTVSIDLDPETVVLSFASNPAGLSLNVNGDTLVAPFNRTAIIGSTNTISAISPQTLGGQGYAFSAWSDGGPQTHTITAPATATSFAATYISSATLFSDGFESGNMGMWGGVTNVTVGSSEVFSGTFAARATSTSTAFAWANISQPSTEVYARVRFKVISQAAANGAYLIRLRSATGSYLIGVYRNSDGRLRLKNDTGGAGANSAVFVTMGVWHELQVRTLIDPVAGRTEVWLDGVPVAALNLTTSTGSTPVGRLQIGDNNATRTFDIAFDDAVVSAAFIGP